MRRNRYLKTVPLVVAAAVWPATALGGGGNCNHTPPGQQKKENGSTGAQVTAKAHGNAGVKAHGSAGVKAHGNAGVKAHGNAGVKAHGNAGVKTHGNAGLKAHGNAGLNAHGNAVVKTQGNAGLKAHGNAGLKARGNAGVRAHGRGNVQASATVQAGVKSSSSTSKNTFAIALSNLTKLYGNGMTAGQIAMANGASANAMLFGPGNSQPHKIACGAHLIDVHALKAHAGACAGVAGQAGAQGQAAAQAQAQAQAQAAAQVQAAVKAKGGAPTKAHAGVAGKSGGVLGASASRPNRSAGAGGVLGASARTGTLPFTGLSLLGALVFGLALLVGGFGLRRLGRTHA